MASMSFKTLGGQSVTVQIGTGKTPVLTPSAKPVIIQMDDDEDFFKPSRLTTGKLTFLDSGNALASLIPSTPTSTEVSISVGNDLVFFGYLKCEAYNQSMDSAVHSVTIPVHDVLSTLGGIYLPYDGDSNHGYITLNQFFNRAFDQVDPEYEIVYCSDNIGSVEICLDNFMSYNDVTEGDAYDTDSYLSVIEEICKYYGLSVRAKGHKIYFSCQDVASSGSHSYTLLRTTDQQVNYIRPKSKIKISAEVGRTPDTLWKLNFDEFYASGYQSYQYDTTNHKFINEMPLVGDIMDQTSTYALKTEVDGTTFSGASAESIAIDDISFSSKIICSNPSGWILTAQSREHFVLCGGNQFALCIEGKGGFADSIADKFDKKDCNRGVFECILQVGKYYFNGTEWTLNSSRFNMYLSPKGGKFYIWETIPMSTYMYFGQKAEVIIPFPNGITGILYFTMRMINSGAKWTSIDSLSISFIKGKPYTGKIIDNDTNTYTASLDNGAKDEYTVDQKLTTQIGVESGTGIVKGTGTIEEKAQLSRYSSILGKKRIGKVINCNFVNVTPAGHCDGMAIIGYKHDLYNDKTTLTLQET